MSADHVADAIAQVYRAGSHTQAVLMEVERVPAGQPMTHELREAARDARLLDERARAKLRSTLEALAGCELDLTEAGS